MALAWVAVLEEPGRRLLLHRKDNWDLKKKKRAMHFIPYFSGSTPNVHSTAKESMRAIAMGTEEEGLSNYRQRSQTGLGWDGAFEKLELASLIKARKANPFVLLVSTSDHDEHGVASPLNKLGPLGTSHQTSCLPFQSGRVLELPPLPHSSSHQQVPPQLSSLCLVGAEWLQPSPHSTCSPSCPLPPGPVRLACPIVGPPSPSSYL